jgi:hypothetical protein
MYWLCSWHCDDGCFKCLRDDPVSPSEGFKQAGITTRGVALERCSNLRSIRGGYQPSTSKTVMAWNEKNVVTQMTLRLRLLSPNTACSNH